MKHSTPIEDAVNIGPVLAGELRASGIDTLEKLRELGYLEAWKRLRMGHPGRCVNSRLALAGALKGVRWMRMPENERRRIADEVSRVLHG